MNKLISIIIPVYNIQGEYFKKCINSITNQDEFGEDIEVIAVNDGSTLENCLNQLEVFKKDNRVRIIDKPNGGVSSARNVEIKQSKGEYILFVDGDDFLEIDCLKRMREIIKKETFDIIFFKHSLYYSDTGVSKKNSDNFSIQNPCSKDELFELSALCKNYKDYNIGTPWAKLLKRKIISNNNIVFDETLSLSEDRVFMIDFLNYSNDIKFFDYSGYIYNENQYSVCKTFNKDAWNKMKKSQEQIEKRFIEYGYENFMDLLKCSKINFFYSAMKLDLFHKENTMLFKEKCNQANEIIKKELSFELTKKYKYIYSRKRRIFNNLFLLKLNKLVYILLSLK